MRDNEGKLTGFNGIARDITVQKEAEETLRESQKMFATIFRSSPDLMVMVDVASGTYLEANDAFCRVTGYPREAIVGHTVDEYDIWCNKAEREKFILQLKRNGKIRDEIIHFRTGSGEIRTLLCSADLLTLKGRQYHLGVAVDITERQKAEQAVIDSEEKFKGAFNASPAPMVLADDRGIYIDVNEAFIRHSGYAREQVIGKPSHEVNIWVFPEEVERINKIMEEEGRVVDEECHVYGKGGDIRTMLLSMEYLIISGRRYKLAVSLDITERKRAEERLMVSDAALKSIRDAVIIMDAQFNIIEWNTVSEQVFGVTAKEAIGRRFGEFVKLEEERPGHNRERWDILLKRGYNREEQLYHTPRGDMWADVRVQEIVKDGERIGWVTLVVDVTPQKQAQEKLAEAYRQEKELRRSLEREAQKRLVFSHALVHELKTPLTPVMASSEILMSGLKEEPWVSLAKNIYHGGENLNKRIDELLDLARGEIGMLKLELSLFSPVELFNEIISEMLPFAAKRNQEVTASIPDSLPLIKGDKVRLRQVVSNIINNAFKFTDYGGKIHFSAKLDGDNLLVTISDNGMGMSEAEQARIFQPYERIEADRQRLSGLGLGLALSKNIIELHGGKIWVNSKKGKGSTFSFCIPVEGPPSQKNIDKQPVKKHKE